MTHRTFFALSWIITTTLASLEVSKTTQDWKTFSDPERPDHLALLVAVHNATGDVYMATLNHLYHLDADLVLKQKVEFGPELVCDAPGASCSSTDFVPIVLAVLYHLESHYLLLCYTECHLRPLEDLRRPLRFDSSGNEAGYLGTTAREYPFFFGSGYGNRTVFYAGADYEPGKNSNWPFFSSRVLGRTGRQERFQFSYSYQSNRNVSAIFFRHPFEQTLIHSFTHGSYLYLLFNRNRGGSHAVLARICIEDGTFTSYVELRLACYGNPKPYVYATSATVGPGFDQGVLADHLYVAFKLQYSVLCKYSFDALEFWFDKAIRECFGSANRTYLLDTETGNFLPCQAKPNVDTCGRSSNPYIVFTERITFPVYVGINLDRLRITYMSLFEENGFIVGVLVFTPGYIFRVVFGVPEGQSILHKHRSLGKTIEKSVAFDPKREHIYFLTSSIIVKYPLRSCSIYTTCQQCIAALADPLGCGWCNGKCTTRQECSSEEAFSGTQCHPSIHSVTPLIGPTRGGTHLTITGEYFGNMSSSTRNHVSIGGVPCHIVLWEMERIICNTAPSDNEVKAAVKLTVRDFTAGISGFVGTVESKGLFSYFDTKIDFIAPDRGSVSGGTNMTIFGTHLDIGKRYEMNIRGRICGKLKVLNSMATCITESSADPDLHDVVELKMDGISIRHVGDPKPGKIFRYLPDPEITGMHPVDTVLSFRGNLTVVGRFFDSLDIIPMYVRINSSEGKELKLKQRCWPKPGSSGTLLMCPVPVLNNKIFNFSEDGQPHLAKLEFDVWPFKGNFSGVLQLSFYPEPEFQEVYTVLDNQTFLEIKGTYPGAGKLAYLTKVEIGGNEPCSISELTSDTLRCEFGPELLNNVSLLEKNLTVTVTTGSSPHHVGFVVIKASEVKEPFVAKASWSVLLASVLILCVLLVTAAVAFCFFRKRRQTKDPTAAKSKNGDAIQPEGGATTQPLLQDNHLQSLAVRAQAIGNFYVDEQQQPAGAVPLALQDLQQDDTEDILTLDETLRVLAEEGWIIPEDLLTLGDVVGAGCYGLVYKGEYISPKHGTMEVAVKTIQENPDLNQTTVSEFLNEGFKMKNFEHENVLQLVGVCFQEDVPMIVTPFMQNGDLCAYLRSENNVLYILDLLGFSAQIASGMNYLAKQKYVHRDLAARNCVISSDMKVKISDFGLSRDVYDDDYYRIGTQGRKLPYKWMAPESMEIGVFTVKSDIWSYGVVLWEIMTRGVLPYATMDNWSLPEFLKSGRRLPQPEYCSQNLYRVMQKCWEYDASKRPSFEELHSDVTLLWRSASCKDRVQNVSAQHNLYCNLE